MRHGNLAMRLFGGFELRCDGQIVKVPQSAHRVLSFLALKDRPLPRGYVADTLWPDTREDKASANLRTVLWRLHSLRSDLIDVSSGEIALDSAVSVDVRTVHHAACEYRRNRTLPPPETLVEIHGELLPGCCDAWLVLERERLREEAIELLETASRACLARGQKHLAMMLCLGAVECDALRESTNLLLVQVCDVNGERIRAIRHARLYAERLKEELGVSPPPPLTDLLGCRANRLTE